MAGARPLSGQSVLIVEPDPITRDNLMQVLEKLGAAVDGVGMAVDAVNAVATTAYSAVVIDETIDTMSGLELAKLVRQELPEGEGRVFVASAGSVSDDACKDAALSGKIEKPLGPKGVLDALLP
jgi:CheY-like chemotaxis protein